jgi:mono/diheme cytochrome c family protein
MRRMGAGNRRICRVFVASALVSSIVVTPGLAASEAATAAQIAEGERLVHNMDCGVCHTPKVMTPEGPRPDVARLLSGHPAGERLPEAPEGLLGPTGWGGLFNAHLTAWVGPWGVSFASNLTPDRETGIGTWSVELFVESMRTGTHVGETRPFLPPMPTYDRLTDEELGTMFQYLRSIEAVENEVPAALPPASADP